VLLISLRSCASVVFTAITVRVSLNLSYFINLIITTCFFGGMMANFDINVYIIASENLFHLCQIGPYGVRLISYNAGRASGDVIIYRRRPAPVWYVTTQDIILKNRPVPGRLSHSPVMWKSLNSYDVSLICDQSIIFKKVVYLAMLLNIYFIAVFYNKK